MLDDMTPITGNPLMSHGMMAFFGAMAHAIRAHRNGTSKTFVDFILLTVMSSFSGVMFSLVASHVFDNQYMTLACAGAGGFLGVEALAMLANAIKKSVLSILTK